MKLQQDDKNALAAHRLQRAKETMEELSVSMRLGYWRTAANRLYFACFYAVNALLVKNNLTANTHNGTINQLGLHFVQNGKMSKENGKLFMCLYELWQRGDYDDWVIIEENDILPLIEPAQNLIADIENLIVNC